MKPALTLTISRDATKEQIEKAIRRVNELKGEFEIIVLMEGEVPSLPEQVKEVKDEFNNRVKNK